MGLAATQYTELLHNPMKLLLKLVEADPPMSSVPRNIRYFVPADLGQPLLPHPSMAMARLGSLEPLVSLMDQWRQIPKIVRAPRRSPVTLSLLVPPSPSLQTPLQQPAMALGRGSEKRFAYQ